MNNKLKMILGTGIGALGGFLVNRWVTCHSGG